MPLSAAQQQVVEAPQRFKVIVAGRRFGKTFLSINRLCYEARLPDRTVWYVAPTYKQAKMIAFKALKRKLTQLRWAKKINETELSFELKNGSVIALKGADNYDSLRGIGLDYLVLDEFADIDPEAWFETLRPTLSDREGGALFIGTPKGMNWAHDLFTQAEEYPEEWASFQYTTLDGMNVKPEEVEAARRSLDERTFRQEFEATFETFSGRIFYAFERAVNVRPFKGELPKHLHVGLDFNVDNNSAVIAVRVNQDVLHIIDEIRLMGSNTDEMVFELKTRFPENTITVYPDPAGAARKTSAGGRTDHSILRTAGFQVKAPNSHNAVRDGINAVNARLKSSTGITSLFVDPGCKYTIESLEKHTYKPNSSVPDKDSGFDHFSDALRYLVDYLFPIRSPVTPPPTRTWSHKIG